MLTELRAQSKTTPILMLTAKETLEDKVNALNYGADDYLIKPFEFYELLARIRALMRRAPLMHNETIQFGHTVINRHSYEITVNGEFVKTSIKEAALLECLFINNGKYVSKETILHILSGKNKDISSNNVEVYVHYLRKKFPQRISGFTIETKQNVGYRIIGDAKNV